MGAPLLIALGLASCCLAVFIVRRLKLHDDKALFFGKIRIWRFTVYMFWLFVQVAKADWAIVKLILSDPMPVRHRLLRVSAGQNHDFTKTLFANSITMTPGTVTVETEPDCFIVHALTDEAADFEALELMNRKVAEIEKNGGA